MKKLCIGLLLVILFAIPVGFTYVCEADEGERSGIPPSGSMVKGKEGDIPIEKVRLPILMYHSFSESEHIDENKEGLYVSRRAFEEQLKYLKEKGCTSIDFNQLNLFLRYGVPIPRNSFIITIDDVYTQQYTIAYPLLKKYGFKATIFINTDSVGKSNRYGWEELKEMEESGYINVQSHGEYHIAMNAVKAKEAALNVTHSFELIEEKLGPRKVKVFCYPSYSCSKKTRELLKDITDIQVTKLGKYVYKDSSEDDICRFRVTNSMTGKDLYRLVEYWRSPDWQIER